MLVEILTSHIRFIEHPVAASYLLDNVYSDVYSTRNVELSTEIPCKGANNINVMYVRAGKNSKKRSKRAGPHTTHFELF